MSYFARLVRSNRGGPRGLVRQLAEGTGTRKG